MLISGKRFPFLLTVQVHSMAVWALGPLRTRRRLIDATARALDRNHFTLHEFNGFVGSKHTAHGLLLIVKALEEYENYQNHKRDLQRKNGTHFNTLMFGNSSGLIR
jgi:hypothetical protein